VDQGIPANKVEEVFKEAKSLQKLNHPNIIKLINVFTLKSNLVLMIEYLPGGDLKNFLTK
jgi:serine/threonine protein kinase